MPGASGSTNPPAFAMACSQCAQEHALEGALAAPYARALIAEIEAARERVGAPGRAQVWRGEYRAHARGPVHDPREDARALFRAGGGKMMGVLVARDRAGVLHVLRAFSGMYAGRWCLQDWVPPSFDVARWYALEARFDPEIARCSAALAACADSPDLAVHGEQTRRRAQLSAALMARYQGLYRFVDGRGRELSLAHALGDAAAASGMGDCCGPKLISEAQRRGWVPVSLAEFFVGAARRPGQREHASMYAPCAEKCGPLLGALLCARDSASD